MKSAIKKLIPNVLCISGHDPSGGAGIQADIESIKACGAHALSIISCTTIQDTNNLHKIIPIEVNIIEHQTQILIKDSSVLAVKIGLLANLEIINSISKSIEPLVNTPIILDPVFSAGGNNKILSKIDLITEIRNILLDKVTLITPNTLEIKQLTNESDFDKAAQQLLDKGVDFVLLTGTHDVKTKNVINTLYSQTFKKQWSWERLPGSYHGSGCTLASSISAYLSQGVDMINACEKAQKFTWVCLKNAYQSGKGQKTPLRIL